MRVTAEAFDTRLDATLAQPLAVAFSGGGDSLAALILSVAWARACGRRVIALHVDHGLQPASSGWAAYAGDVAVSLGAEFQALVWRGAKPSRALAAAARHARHSLIAEAARDAGASVVVFGHTADDLAEAALMQAEGSSLGALGNWRPSPVWPQGRRVMLFRPLLQVRRAEIRAALRADRHRWIEDPANDDLAQPRARARAAVDAVLPPPPPAEEDPVAAALAAAADIDPCAAIGLDRETLVRASAAAARRTLAAALLSAGGGQRPPRGRSVEAVRERLAAAADFATTLAGAKLIARAQRVLIVRDAGELARGGLASTVLEPGGALVWDGRFELQGAERRLMVSALKGQAARLDPHQRRALSSMSAPARPALPVLDDGGDAPTCPILAGRRGVEARSLVGDRFLAACGAIATEPRAVTIRVRGEMTCGALS